MIEPIVIIPIYNATPEFIEFIEDFRKFNKNKVIIIDDGTDIDSKKIIRNIQKEYLDIEIVQHAVRLGIGQSIKSGCNRFLVNYCDLAVGIILIDFVNSIKGADILKISEGLISNPESVIIGNPQNSSIRKDANLVQRIFSLTTHINVEAYQSRIVGIPLAFVSEILQLAEKDKEFEIEILVTILKKSGKIIQIGIHNQQKEFFRSPLQYLLDSTKLIFTFSRYFLLSFSTAAIDYSIFSIFYFLTNNLFLSILMARLLAGNYQFLLGKKWVFKSKNNIVIEIIKYWALVTTLMFVSYGLTTVMVIYLGLSTYLSKLIAEAVLFIMSFTTQKLFIFNSETDIVATNWTEYYRAPIKTSSISRKITEKKLLNIIEKYKKNSLANICELGGGNSCFYEKIRHKYSEVVYTVVDNNQYGLDLFKKKNYNDPNIRILKEDVLLHESSHVQMDIVFSVGLIEHFDKADTAKAIIDHFTRAKSSSLVIITFPTPTWLYTFARGFMSFFRAWPFPDERPLTFAEVEKTSNQYGDLLYKSINWPIVFTQGILVFRKR